MEKPFELEQVYDVSIDTVWQALTVKDQMREWYFPQLIKFEPLFGYKFEFADDGAAYQKEWKVTQVQLGKKLAHSWTYRDYPGNSEVTFELFEEGNGTRLKLTHTGLESFPNDPHFARHRFEDGWKQILESNLKKYFSEK